MGIEDLGLLLENIEEYVMDQKKVVSRIYIICRNWSDSLIVIDGTFTFVKTMMPPHIIS